MTCCHTKPCWVGYQSGCPTELQQSWQDHQKVRQSGWFDGSQQAGVLLISESDSSLILHHFALLSASNWICQAADENINDVIIQAQILICALYCVMLSDKGNKIWPLSASWRHMHSYKRSISCAKQKVSRYCLNTASAETVNAFRQTLLTEIFPLSHHTIKLSALLISRHRLHLISQSNEEEKNSLHHSGFLLTLNSPISYRTFGSSFRRQIALKNWLIKI